MVLVISVDVGVQGTGVDEQRYRFTSARMISSIRSEISEWPLCPAPAAIRRRLLFRPPRCARSPLGSVQRQSSHAARLRGAGGRQDHRGVLPSFASWYASIPSGQPLRPPPASLESLGILQDPGDSESPDLQPPPSRRWGISSTYLLRNFDRHSYETPAENLP